MILDFFSQHFLSAELIYDERHERIRIAHGCHEQHERFAQGRSFVLSDLSDSLTVAHLS